MGPGGSRGLQNRWLFKGSGRFDSCLFRIMKSMYSSIPQVETLLQHEQISRWFALIGRPLTADAVRIAVARCRSIIGQTQQPITFDEVLSACEAEAQHIYLGRVRPVINATGVIIHTNLGRSPISKTVWESVAPLNCGYTNLELSLQSGKRGGRSAFAAELLRSLTQSEAALIVNNNAAAILLILTAFAKRKEVIVSRSELVQIGGGFRIPEILAASGAKLIEVGTTNITTVDDYLKAITNRTSMVLKVHRSNFALRGFTEEPSTADLAKALPTDLLLVVDQGSGVLDDNVAGEIAVHRHINAGAHLVSFSADKALGSVQAGCIVGTKAFVDTLGRHPLYRALRVGKTVSSLLEATLIERLNGQMLPIEQFASRPMEELETIGNQITDAVQNERLSLVDSTMTLGGGSTPDENFPSRSIAIEGPKAQKLVDSLRARDVPIIATIEKDRVHLNLGTLFDHQIPLVISALRELLEA